MLAGDTQLDVAVPESDVVGAVVVLLWMNDALALSTPSTRRAVTADAVNFIRAP